MQSNRIFLNVYNSTLAILESRSKGCHPERSEGSLNIHQAILRAKSTLRMTVERI